MLHGSRAHGFSSACINRKCKKTATNYIGLGDSLAFGYTQQKFEENFPTENPEAFEGGYVTVLANKLSKLEKAAGNKLSTVNLGCPGELSDGLIGHNEAFGGGASAEFNPVRITT